LIASNQINTLGYFTNFDEAIAQAKKENKMVMLIQKMKFGVISRISLLPIESTPITTITADETNLTPSNTLR